MRDIFKEISANGINVDVPGLMKRKSQLQAEELETLDKLDEVAEYSRLRKEYPAAFKKSKKTDPDRFNPRSRKHLTAWFQDRGEDIPHNFQESTLELRLPPDLFSLVMKGRRLRKYWGDLQTLRNHMGMDEKIHVEWTEAVTGRWYTGRPPIQTMAVVCREFLVPDEGNQFFVIDWMQQELRILAHLSNETRLLEIFEKGEDPHLASYMDATGQQISDDPEVRTRQRDLGKLLNYALIYGQDANGLGNTLKIANDVAAGLINRRFAALPNLSEWREEQFKIAAEKGYVETLDGRQIPVVEGTDWRKEALRNRQAVNYKVQGSGAGQLNACLRRVYEDGMINHVRATIHDALLVEAPAGNLEVPQYFKETMEVPFHEFATPVEIKGPADSWRKAMQFIEEPTEETVEG